MKISRKFLKSVLWLLRKERDAEWNLLESRFYRKHQVKQQQQQETSEEKWRRQNFVSFTGMPRVENAAYVLTLHIILTNIRESKEEAGKHSRIAWFSVLPNRTCVMSPRKLFNVNPFLLSQEFFLSVDSPLLFVVNLFRCLSSYVFHSVLKTFQKIVDRPTLFCCIHPASREPPKNVRQLISVFIIISLFHVLLFHVSSYYKHIKYFPLTLNLLGNNFHVISANKIISRAYVEHRGNKQQDPLNVQHYLKPINDTIM